MGVQAVSADVEEVYSEWQEEKEHYLDEVRSLQQQRSLKELVINLFVPLEEVNKVMHAAKWNEDGEFWSMDRVPEAKKAARPAKRPVSASGLRRPTTDFTKTATAAGDLNPRFRPENILSLELDLP